MLEWVNVIDNIARTIPTFINVVDKGLEVRFNASTVDTGQNEHFDMINHIYLIYRARKPYLCAGTEDIDIYVFACGTQISRLT